MIMTGWFSKLSRQHGSMVRRLGEGAGAAILALMAGVAVAQTPAAPATPGPTPEMSIPTGYTIHQSVDLGGRIANVNGGSPMYDTLVNLQSGPRVLNQTFEMRATPGNETGPFDVLNAVSSGFGGDPNNFAKLDFSKGKIYDFSGMFRRDRQYMDYDLLGNPNIPSGLSIPIGPASNPTGLLPYSQVNQSPFLFNTVRRMTDVGLTAAPMAKVTYRFHYSQDIFEGPSMTPSGYDFGGSYSVLIEEFQRNSGDDFLGGIDWKPARNTRLTYEEEINHQKVNSFFNLAPGAFNVVEPDGSPASLLASYFTLTAPTTSSCNANSTGGNPMLTASTMPGGMPVVNPACAVVTNYLRTAPTRILFPTEIFRLQSSSIKNLAFNGDVRYTNANMNMPAYYENFQGLTVAKTGAATAGLVYTGAGSARREVIAADFGAVWQFSNRVSLEEQVTFSNVHQPGVTTMSGLTTLLTGKAAGTETINSPTTSTAGADGASTLPGSSAVATPLPDYFGQKFEENNLSLSWDATSRATFALTYRHGVHNIVEGAASGPDATIVNINEDGAVLNAAVRPTNNWELNGSVEAMYNDNALTPMGFRQFREYRVHTIYRPKTWATVSGAFTDRERHNNTNNMSPADLVAANVAYAGPLDHSDRSRFVSVATDLFPNEHFGLDLNYAYGDVYMADNICYMGGASAAVPLAASTPTGTACPATSAGRSGYDFGPALDFIDAPTHSGSLAFDLAPTRRFQANIGYNVSAVSGSQFFNDPRAVNGMLNSVYQSPFVNVAWKYGAGWTWRAQYNYYGYDEGGASGAQYCSATNPTPTTPATVVPCSSITNLQTGLSLRSGGESLARNFHAGNVLLGVHYEF